MSNPSVSASNNRITSAGYSYDAAGDLVQDPAHAYSYDGENMLTGVDGGWGGTSGASYDYDGEGRRVRKETAHEETVFVYDATGRVVAEYSNRVERNGTRYVTQDALGSTRVVTGQGREVAGRYDYLPFGGEVYAWRAGHGGGSVRQKFTGYERDGETGLDYAQARYYASAHGRFTSVDPLMASGRAGDPQTWNRYTYVYNNPLIFTDPSGLRGDFYNQDGKRLGTDGIDDGKIYVIPDKEQAKQIEQANKKGGTTQVGAVNSAVELPSLAVRTAIGAAVERSNSPSGDDTNGGFHEEGLIAGPAVVGGRETVVNAAPGAYSDPRVDTKATIDVTNPSNPAQAGILADITTMAHVHPSGVLSSTSGPSSGGGTTVFGGTVTMSRADFNQPPSTVDIQNAGTRPNSITNIVVGARSKTVYVYNGSGVRATFPLKQFLNIGRK